MSECADVNVSYGAVNPAYNAGIRIGDTVTAIEGKEIDSVIQMTELLSESDGKTLTLTIMRDGETKQIQVLPYLTETATKSAYGFGTVRQESEQSLI